METKFEKIFGNSARIRVIEFFLITQKISFPIESIIEETKIKKTQVYKIVNELITQQILRKDKKERPSFSSKRLQYYRLNLNNPVNKQLIKTFSIMLKRSI